MIPFRAFSFFLAFMPCWCAVGQYRALGVLSGELTSLFSFLLIGYWHHRKDARRGARMALTVTGTGGLGAAGRRAAARPCGGQLRSGCRAGGARVQSHALLPPLLVLILLGGAEQERAVPLPRAARRWRPWPPVSAYRHSATMVKAGVLLARLAELAGTEPCSCWLRRPASPRCCWARIWPCSRTT